MFLLTVLLFLINKEDAAALNVTIFPAEPRGLDGENLEVRFDVTSTPFTSCSFRAGDVKVSEAEKANGYDYWENREKSSCKLLVLPMVNERKGQWTAEIVTANGNWSGNFSLGMDDKEPAVETSVNETAIMGSPYSYSCLYDKKYAKVYDPQDRLVAEGENAQINIPLVRIQDIGTWKCVVQLKDELSQIKINVNLNVTSGTIVNTKVEETDLQFNLLCHHNDITPTPCIFEMPNGTMIAPRPGVFTEKYGYYGSNQNYDCGLSIKKPLEEGEKGFWKCMMASPLHASLLNVGGNETVISSTKYENIAIVAGDNLTIECNVRRPLTYCYLTSPADRVFSSQYTGMGLGQGSCRISIEGSKLWINESGTWTCGMGIGGKQDIHIPIKVLIAESQFNALAPQAEALLGDTIRFSCVSTLGYGLRYCRFTHPSGLSLNMASHPSVATQGRFSYYGKGLDEGECGIEIQNMEIEDLGTWTCAAAFIGRDFSEEFQDQILLTSTPISFESLVAISVVLGILAILGVAGFLYWGQKRKHRQSSFSVFDVSNMRYFPQNRRSTQSSLAESDITAPELHLS